MNESGVINREKLVAHLIKPITETELTLQKI